MMCRLLMNNKMPSTLCWLYDIMYLLGIKYDPRDVTTQERKTRRALEDVIVQLTTDTALISASQGITPAEDRFSLSFPFNPSICGILEEIPVTDEERKSFVGEREMLNVKITKMLPQLERISVKDAGPRTKGVIEGAVCGYYLKGFCFLTLKAMLYDLTATLLSVANKDKMEQVVRIRL